MWTQEDKEVAERATHVLGKLQNQTGPGVLQQIDEIREQVGNKRTDRNQHERAHAWLSICNLATRLEVSPDAEEIPGLWHRAIQAVNAWRGSMR